MRPHFTNRIHRYLKSRGSIHETRGNQLPVFALGSLCKRSLDCFSGVFCEQILLSQFQLYRYLHEHPKQIHSESCCIDPAAASVSPFTCLSVFVLIVLSLYVYFCLSICLSVCLSGCLFVSLSLSEGLMFLSVRFTSNEKTKRRNCMCFTREKILTKGRVRGCKKKVLCPPLPSQHFGWTACIG